LKGICINSAPPIANQRMALSKLTGVLLLTWPVSSWLKPAFPNDTGSGPSVRPHLA
jgi:hypothetical protein